MTVSAATPQAHWIAVTLIGAAAVVLNVPLGYAREGLRRFSPGWFVCVHLSVPLIVYLRLANHVGTWAIPLFVGCAVAGQVAGGRARRCRQAHP